jgi:hypothetical protein
VDLSSFGKLLLLHVMEGRILDFDFGIYRYRLFCCIKNERYSSKIEKKKISYSKFV